MKTINSLLLLVAITTTSSSHAFHTPSTTARPFLVVEPLSMIRKSKKSTTKTVKTSSSSSSGRGFGAGSSSNSDSSSSSSSSSTATLSSPAWAKNFRFAGNIRPGAQTEQKVVIADHIIPPDYAIDGTPRSAKPMLPWVIEVKTPDQIAKMRESGRLARKVLDLAGRAVKPGVTTNEIDEIVHQATIEVRWWAGREPQFACFLILYAILLYWFLIGLQIL